jgi:hypothetical protein
MPKWVHSGPALQEYVKGSLYKQAAIHTRISVNCRKEVLKGMS